MTKRLRSMMQTAGIDWQFSEQQAEIFRYGKPSYNRTATRALIVDSWHLSPDEALWRNVTSIYKMYHLEKERQR